MQDRKVKPFEHGFWGFAFVAFGIYDLFVLDGWWSIATIGMFWIAFLEFEDLFKDLDYLIGKRNKN